MGRRSRSRSRERRRSPKASKKETKNGRESKSVKDKEKERSPPRRDESSDESDGERPAWASDEDGDTGGGGEEVPLEARVALLEVENETLKAENRELRKKLVEALKRKPNVTTAPARQASSRVEATKDKSERQEVRKERDPEPSPADKRRERTARREAELEQKKDEPPPDESARNAVLLANDQMEAYNEPIPNNIAPEKRLPLVNEKLDRFLSHFDDKVQIIDLKSGGVVLKDKATFTKRYGCVFRESGSYLKGTTNKRFYYDAMHRPTYVLDFETHDNLVTAMPGTPPDGKLGVRKPRTEHLIVLYEERGGKLTRMWLSPDADKLGSDKKADEEALLRTEIVKKFEAKIAELRDSPNAGPRIYQNYLDIPTVG
eukprot:TRINITY_DN54718_c0_g1_i1.p1 TRINITY_DN54718_c0_g1~~TRINITY_DN54718_c0_g1_i1.p1  ORF type:complete len:374 (-),score=71.82 TRINITY_DN54718_c0_g1_i1:109-1230(-)